MQGSGGQPGGHQALVTREEAGPIQEQLVVARRQLQELWTGRAAGRHAELEREEGSALFQGTASC